MFTGVRPCLSAGVALVGASVIAVTPISPAPAASAVASPAVQLAAIPSPLQLYPQVLVKSLTNVGGLFEQYLADPFPIIGATLENQAVAFENAVTALQFGRADEFFAAVADIVLQPVKSVGQSIGYVLSYLGVVLDQPGGPEYLFNIAFSPLLNGIAATSLAIADVFDAIATFDVIGLVNAVINVPARIIDGVLNGVPEDYLFGGYYVPALLTPLENSLPPGLIAQAIDLDQQVGAAIAEQGPAAIDGWSGPEAQTMMLTTEPETELLPVDEESIVEGEAVLGEDAPGTEDLDLPTSDGPVEETLAEEEPTPAEEEPALAEEEPALAGEEAAPAEEEAAPAEEAEDEGSSAPPADTGGDDPPAEGNNPGGEAS